MLIHTETAYAKINLALHVRRRRIDGYHDLETLFAFVDEGDKLTAHSTEQLSLSINGPFAKGLGKGDDNLIMQTAKLLQRRFAVEAGATIMLEKNLPVASGIGGGSADAAATARILNSIWGINASNDELASLLAPLGADIPACVLSKTVFGSGTGTTLSPVIEGELKGMPVLLVNAMTAVATRAVFQGWDGIDHGGLDRASLIESAVKGRNDLQASAIAISPGISNVLSALQATRPIYSRMSGSGATCFALYETIDARDAARNEMDNDWWTLAGRLR